jgi:hypothetical protein
MHNKTSAIAALYNDGWEQKDIATVLKLSEVTISRHVVKFDMKKKRTLQSLSRKTSEENCLIAMEHQSTIIRMMSEKLREELEEHPDLEKLKAALIPKGEIDALQKLATTIKTKELEWSAVVKIIREFTVWLKDEDIRLAQEIVDYGESYINEKRTLLQ